MRQRISPQRLRQLIKLLECGNEHQFYCWGEWLELREYVFTKLDHCECQICRSKGRFRKGYIVHHVKPLRQRPDLALSVYDSETGERQLITVCKRCHEELHPESLKSYASAKKPITEERWD